MTGGASLPPDSLRDQIMSSHTSSLNTAISFIRDSAGRQSEYRLGDSGSIAASVLCGDNRRQTRVMSAEFTVMTVEMPGLVT